MILSGPEKKVINSVYNPPRKLYYHTDEKLILNHFYYYSFARFAILDALKILEMGNGKKILIPEFICKDVLAPFNQQGLELIYYPVDKSLRPIINVENIKSSDLLLLVNYFGFSQDISHYQDLCKEYNTLIIEDNAHGFLSKDDNDNYLGTIGDIGIFSFRKTIPMPNGAGLYLRNLDKKINKIDTNFDKEDLNFKLKNMARFFTPLIGATGWQKLTKLIRKKRKIDTGYEIAISNSKEEYQILVSDLPCDVKKYLEKSNWEKEVKRRRDLYKTCEKLFEKSNTEAVFKYLPTNVCPYGYPFYFKDMEAFNSINKLLNSIGLEAFNWPDLPAKIKHVDKYTNIGCVRFLW